MLVTGIAHIGVRVHDLERARAFYELLGFQFVIGPVGPEPIAVMSHSAGIEVNLILNAVQASEPNVLMDVDEKHAGYTHIALSVSSVEEAASLLEDAGFPVTEGPVTFPNGSKSIFVRDPDRNVVELNQPPLMS